MLLKGTRILTEGHLYAMTTANDNYPTHESIRNSMSTYEIQKQSRASGKKISGRWMCIWQEGDEELEKTRMEQQKQQEE
jgi:hypothetical protein